MNWFAAILLVTGFVPLAQALRANRRTTLRHSLAWAMVEWAAWNWVAWSRFLFTQKDQPLAVYVALCLTGCAGIAVLGARRPGVTAWHFVVLGLLAVLLLPVVNGLGGLRLEPAQELFLTITLVVPFLNYLPTRLGPGILLTAVGCTLEMAQLLGWIEQPPPWLNLILLACGPWAAWGGLSRRGSVSSEFDRIWLTYRDGFGFFWGQRMREQFNRAAHHAGWPVVLRWQGLRTTSDQPMTEAAELVGTLRAVLKRFGPDEEKSSFS